MAKRTRGRQRVEMKKMQNEEQLQVTFSRRRLGLFKMANEISATTGSQIALIVFSPNNRVYPFGSPDLKPVIDRYEQQSHQPLTGHHMLVDSHTEPSQKKLNSELLLLQNKVEALKKQKELLDQMIEKQKSEYWLEALTEELESNKLGELLKAMKELDKEVTNKIDTMFTSLSQQNNTCRSDYLSNIGFQVPFDLTVHPSGIHGFSSPIMRSGGFNQMAPFESRAPTTMDCYQNAAGPSIVNGVSSSRVGKVRSSALAHFGSRDSDVSSVVQPAGSLRGNAAFGMISGASSSNLVDSFDSIAPRFQGVDMPRGFNLSYGPGFL